MFLVYRLKLYNNTRDSPNNKNNNTKVFSKIAREGVFLARHRIIDHRLKNDRRRVRFIILLSGVQTKSTRNKST